MGIARTTENLAVSERLGGEELLVGQRRCPGFDGPPHDIAVDIGLSGRTFRVPLKPVGHQQALIAEMLVEPAELIEKHRILDQKIIFAVDEEIEPVPRISKYTCGFKPKITRIVDVALDQD